MLVIVLHCEQKCFCNVTFILCTLLLSLYYSSILSKVENIWSANNRASVLYFSICGRVGNLASSELNMLGF